MLLLLLLIHADLAIECVALGLMLAKTKTKGEKQYKRWSVRPARKHAATHKQKKTKTNKNKITHMGKKNHL